MLEPVTAIIYEFYTAVKPLSLFIVAITIYALFVFKFYVFLSRRDILKMKHDGTETNTFLKMLGKITSHTIQNLILIPLLIFFWFAVLAALLMLLSKNHTPETLMLTSLAIVGAVRISSYYNELLSQDLAKMIPFALLAVFLVDISYFSLDNAITLAEQLPSYWKHLIYYLVFVALLEFILRTIELIIKAKKQRKEYAYSHTTK